jgi:hypothetical protein
VKCGARSERAAYFAAVLVPRFAAVVLALLLNPGSLFGEEKEEKSPAFHLETLRGQVGFLGEILERKYGITSVPEAKDRTIVLATTEGKLVPLVEDVRGRAFRRDERLRKMDLELVLRRYDDFPEARVIRVYELAKDGKYEIDYWCDICAIPMYELKDCECCQGPIELRKRKQ